MLAISQRRRVVGASAFGRPGGRCCADLGVPFTAGMARSAVIGVLVLGLALASGCTSAQQWSHKWLMKQDFWDGGVVGDTSSAQREALREMAEDVSLSDRRRAAAWLRGALTLLPPAAMASDEGEADEWLERASALDLDEGGPGTVARTLLALLASLRSERSDHATAEKSAAECSERLQALDQEMGETRRELETLKAIDLAPMPGEPEP
jgi:hypothetical protein